MLNEDNSFYYTYNSTENVITLKQDAVEMKKAHEPFLVLNAKEQKIIFSNDDVMLTYFMLFAKYIASEKKKQFTIDFFLSAYGYSLGNGNRSQVSKKSYWLVRNGVLRIDTIRDKQGYTHNTYQYLL